MEVWILLRLSDIDYAHKPTETQHSNLSFISTYIVVLRYIANVSSMSGLNRINRTWMGLNESMAQIVPLLVAPFLQRLS